ncbi:Peptidase T [Serratia rubidaea]|uniref:Peptidase T n=1 Tax=Serratia rubidaea TaxID=61652 RepID=A0A447QSZ6_SERRU|nr:Peptidase T [Serratia rubidaea]
MPSTDGQLKLARALQQELLELGFAQVMQSEQGCVTATLPSNVAWPVPAIGFISHLDTSPDVSGKQVNPQIVENYRGGDIALGIGDEVLSPVRFPVLHQLLGQTLITTDGKTLLGADDKAGIAEIMTAMVRLRQQQIPHGDIRIAFTPDEEVGKGARYFDVESFNAAWAYTVDGGGVGELECENFNAASAVVKIVGNNAHPGSAKGVMVNALTLATRFHQCLPAEETPENTADYQGFYHLSSIKGQVDRAEMHYILRDFERDGFAARKRKLMAAAEHVGKGCRASAASTSPLRTATTICASRWPSIRTWLNWRSGRCSTAGLNRCSSRSAAAPTAHSSLSRGCRALICLPAATTSTANTSLLRWRAWSRRWR